MELAVAASGAGWDTAGPALERLGCRLGSNQPEDPDGG